LLVRLVRLALMMVQQLAGKQGGQLRLTNVPLDEVHCVSL